MHSFLRDLARATQTHKSARGGRPARNRQLARRKHGAERLEDRTLLAADSGMAPQAPAFVATSNVPGLTISNQAATPSLNAGNIERYTLTITNDTPLDQSFVLTDVLPAGATNGTIYGGLLPGMPEASTKNGASTMTFYFGIASGLTATFDVAATLNTPGIAYNVVSMRRALGDQPIIGEATAVAFVNGPGAPVNGPGAPAADLSITNTASTATVGLNGTETYTLVVTNTDEANPSNGVVVTDVLPAFATNVTTSGPSGAAFTTNNGVVTASLGNLAPGASDTLTITADFSNTGIVVNAANVEAATADENQVNNNSAATAIVTSPAQLFCIIPGPASDTVGQPMAYGIDFGNTGGTTATGAIVTDVLPAGLTLVSATDPHGTIVVNGNTITDYLGALASLGGSEGMRVTVIPAAALGGTSVTNTAALTFNGATQQQSVVTRIVEPRAFFLQSAPGDGTAAADVTNLYWNLLGRAPDSAGLQSWVAYLTANANAYGQQVMVSSFLNSPEYKSHYITSLYAIFLGRAPDPAGFAYWTAKLGNPGTLGGATGSADEKQVLAAILGSDEFYYDAGGTPQNWIDALYEDLLGRAPGSDEAAFWQQELATGAVPDRDGMARDILSSPEAVHDMLDMFYPDAGGTATTALPVSGDPAGGSGTKLAELTGGGWENLYFSGPFGGLPEGNDGFYAELVGGAGWDVVQFQMLTSLQYYSSPNPPQAKALGD